MGVVGDSVIWVLASMFIGPVVVGGLLMTIDHFYQFVWQTVTRHRH